MCSATKEQGTALNDTIHMSLDDALEYIADDELVEVSLHSHHLWASGYCLLSFRM